jgi:chromosome segregation ATPase
MKKTCAAVLAIGMAILWLGGCQEEQASSDVKQSRLVAAENRELKTQFQQETKKRDEEIKNLNTQMQTETKKRDDEIKNLNSQIRKRDKEIEDLSSWIQKRVEQFQAEMKNRDDDVNRLTEELAQCEQANQKIIKAQEEEQKRLEGMMSDLMGGDTALAAKIEQLKAELADCKGNK